MNTPKLPPLPHQLFLPSCLGFTEEQMNVHYLKGYNDALAAIKAHGVPDGWQLVPKEPTDEMVRAALHLDLSYMPGHDGPDRAAVYKAMLASAPPVPQASVVQQEPFAYYQPECHQNIMEARWRDREASRSDNSTMIAYAKACTEPLYTRPAQQAKPQPLSDEQDRALCEAHCDAASDEYFKARPQLDSDVNRRIFYAGHRKAWINWQAAHGIVKE